MGFNIGHRDLWYFVPCASWVEISGVPCIKIIDEHVDNSKAEAPF